MNDVYAMGCGGICPSTISIVNSGPAIAKNVSVTFASYNITDKWGSSINDIAKFSVETYPRTLETSIKIHPGAVPQGSLIEIDINTLLPDSSTAITIQPNFPKSAMTKQINQWPITVYLYPKGYTPTMDNINNVIDKMIYSYLQNKFFVAALEIGLTCDSCKTSQSNTYPFETEFGTTVSSLLFVDSFDTFEETLQKSSNGYVWYGRFATTLEVPRGPAPIHIASPLYLRATGINPSDEAGIGNVEECQPTLSLSNRNTPYCEQSN